MQVWQCRRKGSRNPRKGSANGSAAAQPRVAPDRPACPCCCCPQACWALRCGRWWRRRWTPSSSFQEPPTGPASCQRNLSVALLAFPSAAGVSLAHVSRRPPAAATPRAPSPAGPHLCPAALSWPLCSKWGSLRAAMGHPEPWTINFMAIGNEVCALRGREHALGGAGTRWDSWRARGRGGGHRMPAA